MRAPMVFYVLRQIRDKARAELRITSFQSHKRWERGEESGLLGAVSRGLLEEKWVAQAIIDLQKKQHTAPTRLERAQAAVLLKKVAAALTAMGKGQTPQLGPEEKEEIIASCEKWRPVCEELNKAFKDLWKKPEYKNELYQKEARGTLAEKFSISVADVIAIETYLKKKSRRSRKTTPWDVMLRMVAREPKHGGVGVKTVENIYMTYRKSKNLPS